MKTAVLLSGNGSNLQALIDAASMPGYPAQIALVISNRAGAYGLERAKHAGIPAVALDHKAHASRESFDRAMHAALLEHGIETVCLAGFMRLLSPWFVEEWRDRLLNIHPSLLPAFKGGHAQRDALAAGVKIAGCSVHFVRVEMDSGPIIAQAAVPVLPGDTEESLHARVLREEHKLYPQALRWLAEGKLRLEGETVQLVNAPVKEAGVLVVPST